MSDIVTVLRSCPGYIGGTGRTREDIQRAEEKLGCLFAKDYKEYLASIGLACFDGHELTGIGKVKHVDVVETTLMQRKHFPEATNWYVVEETHVDGIVIWQSTSGEIYQTAPQQQFCKINQSLVDYVNRLFFKCAIRNQPFNHL